VAAKQPLCGGAARHRGGRRLYASPLPPPQTVAPSTPLFRRQRRPYTIYNAYVRVLYWGDFFLIFFSTASESFFFLLTPRRSSWPRSNGYTNDFGLIFCFPHRLSSITHSFSLSLCVCLSPSLPSPFHLSLFMFLSLSVYLSLYLVQTHTHTYIPWPVSYTQWRVVFILNPLPTHACLPLHTPNTHACMIFVKLKIKYIKWHLYINNIIITTRIKLY